MSFRDQSRGTGGEPYRVRCMARMGGGAWQGWGTVSSVSRTGLTKMAEGVLLRLPSKLLSVSLTPNILIPSAGPTPPPPHPHPSPPHPVL